MVLIDYQAVRALTNLEGVLHLLGAPSYNRRGDRGRGPCPLMCEEDPRACCYDFGRNLWKCFRCEEGGNHLDLFCVARRLPLTQGAKELCRWLGQTLPLIVTSDPKNGC